MKLGLVAIALTLVAAEVAVGQNTSGGLSMYEQAGRAGEAWAACARERAMRWASMREGADVIAEAALSACSTEFERFSNLSWSSTLEVYRSSGVAPPPEEQTRTRMREMRERVKGLLIARIIEARATPASRP